ncbi:fatty acid desaturase [Novosphingobium sp. 17-62-19]|uniref:fatty acid desaturase n=1 Tax=Novosphingobium sp. 17-62-19 TaxID=1970406 RepID=UPI0025E14A6D|nr:fatty acid desaturase [Novosphingobium sp. 17-62-19]HQS96715.1 fatty acid desaturase [Novosphingobium sp.]
MTCNRPQTHNRSASSIRARLRTGISPVDDIVTRLTGKALPNQQPYFDIRPELGLAIDAVLLVATFAITVTLAQVLVAAHSLLALIVATAALFVAQLVLVGRLRVMQVGHAHYAVHGCYAGGDARTNLVVAHVATIIAIAQNPFAYRGDHIDLHHRRSVFGTLADPDAALLHELGFRPGMTRGQLYLVLARTLVSPSFHAMFLAARLQSNLVDAPVWRRLVVATWLAALLSSAWLLGLIVWGLAVFLPFVVLYANSALLQFLTEHKWMAGDLPRGDNQAYADRSHARIALAPMPLSHQALVPACIAWSVWTVRQIGELLFRLSVTVGDLTVHDFHHLHGLCKEPVSNWIQIAFVRQSAIDKGDKLKLAERETVGAFASLNWVFEGLKHSPVAIAARPSVTES